MKRQLTITAAEWASIRTEGDPATFSATGGRMVRTLWLVARGNEHWLMAPDEPKLISATPPAEFVQVCAPCEMCHESRCDLDMCEDCGNEYEEPCSRHADHGSALCDSGCCLSCRIELVGPCPWDTNSDGDCWHCSKPGKHHTLGHAYAVGEPLLLHDWPGMGISPGMLKALAHYGPPESLVDKWALELKVVGS